MLSVIPEQRLSLSQIMNSSWFNDEENVKFVECKVISSLDSNDQTTNLTKNLKTSDTNKNASNQDLNTN